MTPNTVHLEDVIRAARRGLGVSAIAAALVSLALLGAGLQALPTLLTAGAVLAIGVGSGGFGLVARTALPPLRRRKRGPGVPRDRGADALAPLRVPQPR